MLLYLDIVLWKMCTCSGIMYEWRTGMRLYRHCVEAAMSYLYSASLVAATLDECLWGGEVLVVSPQFRQDR